LLLLTISGMEQLHLFSHAPTLRFMHKPLMVLVTGEPVPEAERTRGPFLTMIQQACDAAWPGEWLCCDLRSDSVLPEYGSVSGLVVTGSPEHLGDRKDWMLRGLDYLRGAVAARLPTLGICFGHQMLGEALGGRVATNPRGREIGTVAITSYTDNPLLRREEPFTANMSHLDSIVSLPEGALVLASTAQEPNALVRFTNTTWGVQFHPEMDAAIVRQYVLARAAAIEAEGQRVDALLSELGDSHAARRVLSNFVLSVVLG
jgi:GMP synthase (glutamine-hydrolysing)